MTASQGTTLRAVAPRARHEVEALVTGNLAVVGYQVNEMMARLPGHVHRDDLTSAGMAALAAAAMSYDATTGVPFARYATLRIRGALLDELRAMDWAPRGTRSRARVLESTEERLTAELGRRPSREELAAALGCDPESVDAVRDDARRNVLSLDAYDGTLGDVLPHADLSPEEHILQDERVRYLQAAVASLPERLRTVVAGIFLHDRSVAEVAAELGVTESRISQLRTEALALMKDGMNASLEPTLVSKADRPGGVVDRRRQAYYAAVAANAAATPAAAASPAVSASSAFAGVPAPRAAHQSRLA